MILVSFFVSLLALVKIFMILFALFLLTYHICCLSNICCFFSKEKIEKVNNKIEKNFSIIVSTALVCFLLSFIFLFVYNYNQSSYVEKQVKQASQVVKEYNQTISLAPKLQYADFLYKLKKGDFVTYQEIYNKEKDKYISIYTDKYGQKFHPLMIQNAENNSNLSEYYKEIKILNSFSNKTDFHVNNSNEFFILDNNHNIAFYCNNKKAFQDFFHSNKKESDFLDIDCSI